MQSYEECNNDKAILSICLSATLQYCAKTDTLIVKIYLLPDSPMTMICWLQLALKMKCLTEIESDLLKTLHRYKQQLIIFCT